MTGSCRDWPGWFRPGCNDDGKEWGQSADEGSSRDAGVRPGGGAVLAGPQGRHGRPGLRAMPEQGAVLALNGQSNSLAAD